MNNISVDILQIVLGFFEDSLHGLLRQVCSVWCLHTRTSLFACAHITTKELLQWAEKQPGYNEALCMEIMAFKQRDDLMQLFENSVHVRDGHKPVILNAMVMRRSVVHDAKDAYDALPLQWGWRLWPKQRPNSINEWQLDNGIERLQQLNGTRVNAERYMWVKMARRGILHTVKDRLDMMWMDAAQVTPAVLAFICNNFYNDLSNPFMQAEVHTKYARLMRWLSENVLILHDAYVLSLMSAHEITWMIPMLMAALKSKREYIVNPVEWKFAAGVGLAIAIVHAHTGLINTFYQLCCATGVCLRIKPALEHANFVNQIQRVLNAVAWEKDFYVGEALDELCSQIKERGDPAIEHPMTETQIARAMLSWDQIEHRVFFASNVLFSDGESRKWMLEQGPILPVNIAHIVVRNKRFYDRAKHLGFEFPDMSIKEDSCML